jgi:hypothetical protein
MTRLDLAILALACAVVTTSFVVLWTPDAPARQLELLQANGALQRITLDEDRHLAADGHMGESLIEIRDGQARFLDSPCRERRCIHYGWARHAGETVACLPNGVLFRLAGGDHGYDAVNF